MSNYVIVRINHKLIPEFQINFNSGTNVAVKSNISAWAEINVNNEKLILILPGHLVFTTQVKIPSKNEEIIRQSIPNTIEEELASDIDQNHYAYELIGEEHFLVSVVSKQVIENINKQLEGSGLKCDELYSEIFTCPYHVDTTSFCIQENKLVIIRDNYAGSCIKPDVLKSYIKLSKNTKRVGYIDSSTQLSIDSNKIKKVQDLTLLQSNSLLAQSKVNLFQGEFSKDKEDNKSNNPWKKLLLLISILLVSWLAISTYKIWKLSSEINSIKDKQSALFLKLIPDASQSEQKDPYSALLSRLKLSENSSNQSNTQGFIVSLNYIGKTLIKHPNIQVQSLRQRSSKLEIKLQAQNINQLNQFQKDLENIVYSFRVKTGTRNSNKEGVSSVITLEQL